ncbi:MAG: hypothetical protein ACFB21_15170 [Opitutales bacterium]
MPRDPQARHLENDDARLEHRPALDMQAVVALEVDHGRLNHLPLPDDEYLVTGGHILGLAVYVQVKVRQARNGHHNVACLRQGEAQGSVSVYFPGDLGAQRVNGMLADLLRGGGQCHLDGAFRHRANRESGKVAFEYVHGHAVDR